MLRPASPGFADALTTSHAVLVRADVWRGGRSIAADVPILDGSWTESADQGIAEGLTLRVPLVGPDGRRWAPAGRRGDDAPLGSDGHRLRLTYTIPRADGTALSCPLGWVRIDEWSVNGAAIELSGSGLMSLIESYRLLTPTSPPAGATLQTEFIRLVDSVLPSFWAASTSRAASSAMAWTEDRLAALREIAAAAPAALRIDPAGVLVAEDVPTVFAADLVLVEGAGTVIEADEAGERDRSPNIVVARGEDSGDPDRPPVYAVARNDDPSSPTNVADYGPVVAMFASPLLRTSAQAYAAAATRLRTAQAAAALIPVRILPDPRIMAGSMVELRRRDGRVQQTTVAASDLALVAQGGAQSLKLSPWVGTA